MGTADAQEKWPLTWATTYQIRLAVSSGSPEEAWAGFERAVAEIRKAKFKGPCSEEEWRSTPHGCPPELEVFEWPNEGRQPFEVSRLVQYSVKRGLVGIAETPEAAAAYDAIIEKLKRRQ